VCGKKAARRAAKCERSPPVSWRNWINNSPIWRHCGPTRSTCWRIGTIDWTAHPPARALACWKHWRRRPPEKDEPKMKLTILSTFLALACTCYAQSTAHHDAVNQHGDQVMGFSHEKTTHHFRLYADGGAIEVTANDPRTPRAATRFRCTFPTLPACSVRATLKRPC